MCVVCFLFQCLSVCWFVLVCPRGLVESSLPPLCLLLPLSRCCCHPLLSPLPLYQVSASTPTTQTQWDALLYCLCIRLELSYHLCARIVRWFVWMCSAIAFVLSLPVWCISHTLHTDWGHQHRHHLGHDGSFQHTYISMQYPHCVHVHVHYAFCRLVCWQCICCFITMVVMEHCKLNEHCIHMHCFHKCPLLQCV